MNDLSNRPSLTKRQPLTDDEVLWFIDDADRQVGSQMRGHAQYVARFALEQIWAVKRFEKSSTRWALVVTVTNTILIALTALLAYFTIVLARKP